MRCNCARRSIACSTPTRRRPARTRRCAAWSRRTSTSRAAPNGYGAAYRALLGREPADLYVIFGTGHAGPTAPVTGLPLDWETPLGIVTTDRGFVDAVHQKLGAPSPLDLLIHRDEHSLEFQVLWLQHLHQRHFGERPFRVACFLCGALPSADGDPLREPWLQELLSTFRDAAAATRGRVCFVAGADLAHLGPFFGDPEPIDDQRLTRLDADERARLAHLERGAPGPFHAAVDGCGNPDRVCSGPAITLCAALAGGAGELLHYGQARAADDSQVVSFCAMAFAGEQG
ncbi:MAG: AmmeMemoRadiSam system protein B [Planctomycetota bacterium]